MPLPIYYSVPIEGRVQKISTGTEKLHMIYTKKNYLLFPSSIPYLEFTSLEEYEEYFGKDEDYIFIQRYFNFISKETYAPDKVIITNWFQQPTEYFFKSKKITSSIFTDLKKITQGTLQYVLNTGEIITTNPLDFSAIVTWEDIITVLQTAIETSTIVYNEQQQCLVFTAPIITKFEETEVSLLLGLYNGSYSPAVTQAEDFAEYCDRILKTNSSGYSITINEQLSNEDITQTINWLQTAEQNQTYNTLCRVVLNWKNSLEALEAFKTTINPDYTGYVLCYDPYNENINIQSCAICASTDYEKGSSKNFNFQYANEYTPITNEGNIIDYQEGKNNIKLMQRLRSINASTIYSQGIGTNTQKFYGEGFVAGSFYNESIMCNEAWFERYLQQTIFENLTNHEKIILQGKESDAFISNAIIPCFNKAQENGVIASGGKLSDKTRVDILNKTKNNAAPDAVATNGYFFQIFPLNEEDLKNSSRRIQIVYLCGGEINKVLINNYIYRG